MMDTTPADTWMRSFNLSEVVPPDANSAEIAHHANKVRSVLISLDPSDFAAVLRGVLMDCEDRLASTLADLIDTHRAAEAAVEASADDDVAARYDELVAARVELLAYAPQSVDEARLKATYVRGSADCTDDEFGEPAIMLLLDRLCEFRPV